MNSITLFEFSLFYEVSCIVTILYVEDDYYDDGDNITFVQHLSKPK